MKRTLVAVAFLAAFCGGRATHEKPAPATAKPAAPIPANLLELSRGAAVVSRTGEAVLSASALRAIDGDPHSMWVSPPSDPMHLLVFSLPARARIDHVGVRTSDNPAYQATSLRIDLSADGTTFTPAATLKPKPSTAPQLIRIAPTEASFVRMNILGGPRFVQIGSVHASGTLLDPVKPGQLGGCFSLDGQPASFTQTGSGVSGSIGGIDGSSLEGGSDGRLYRFAWVRGPEYGLAAVTVTPDGNHVSGIVWHEEAIQDSKFLGKDLLGDRVPCGAAALHHVSVLRVYLERFRYFPLFGLRFDDSGHLLENESNATLAEVTAFLLANPKLPVTFAAHELLQSTPELDRRLAQARIDSLRAALQKNGVNLAVVKFVAHGAEKPHREASIDLTRAMYSSIDLELKP